MKNFLLLMLSKPKVLLVIFIMVIGGGFTLIHGSEKATKSPVAKSNNSTSPTPSPSETPMADNLTPRPSPGTPNPSPSATFVLPPGSTTDTSGLPVNDETQHKEDAALNKKGSQWIQATLNTKKWEIYAINNLRPDILDKLSDNHGARVYGVVYADLVEAKAKRQVPTISGNAIYNNAQIVKLSKEQQAGVGGEIDSTPPSDAILLGITGPVKVTFGSKNTDLIAKVNESRLLVGTLKHDVTLGDIWVIAYSGDCADPNDPTSILCRLGFSPG